jgi:hypothetical protein
MHDDLHQDAQRAAGEMQEYQDGFARDPHRAQVFIGGLRHALIPTHVLSRELPQEIDELIGVKASHLVMSRLGRLTGRAQAEAFFAERQIGPDEAMLRVICGPMYFAWAGYADVDLLLTDFRMDEHFAVLWESNHSFSASEALSDGDRGRSCTMQAGYAAGWCEAASGLPLETREIACRAEGVSHCRFLIAPAANFEQRMREPRFHRATSSYPIMRFDSNGLVDIDPRLSSVTAG